jgi:DNA-binding HxlR family transcriptional regulator
MRSHCPVSLALEAIGDRWSLLVLRDLVLRGKRRFQEFLNSEERIATNVLADRLARFERQRLVVRRDDPHDRRQTYYAPTQKALDLLPVIFAMARWSAKYDPHVDREHPLLRRLHAGEEGLQRQILAQFKDAPRV